MATATPSFATETAITLTLTSLADAGWRQSTVIDNTSNLYIDALVGGSVQAGTSPTAGTTIQIWAYATRSGGNSTNYTGGASGSDAAYTADGEETLFRRVTFIKVDATSDQDYVWGPISMLEVFGGIAIPGKWGIVVKNDTGAALNATGTNNDIKYTGIKIDIA